MAITIATSARCAPTRSTCCAAASTRARASSPPSTAPRRGTGSNAAWLLNRAARAALADFPLRYTSDPAGLIRLPQWQPLAAPTLVWSARSAWRRRLSQLWNERLLRRAADRRLLRLGLHPVDLRHAGVRAFWLRTIGELLPQRRALTKQRWLELEAAA